MAEVGTKIRLFVDAALGPGAEVMLAPDQAHYLFNVMRVSHGAEVAVFNGRDGEWLSEVVRTGRLRGAVTCRAPGRPQRHPPDVWLVFAPGQVGAGSLAGDYVGATAAVAAGLGLGANVLVGGSNKQVSLQPVSVEGSVGLNVAGGLAEVELKAVR